MTREGNRSLSVGAIIARGLVGIIAMTGCYP
jgi:hypothetical protein